MMKIETYLTVRHVAKQLGLTEYRVRQLIREKQIRATKIKQWRIKPEDLDNFIKSRSNI
ncbi:MAG: helix-turn-helix domain-containing protein [Candidatus Omnitrophica bacterium]|nr:helix-turn-helix domain-containing protein [Candidatus Omnitrophota bacterium]